MTDRHYDAIFLGEGLLSLAAAATLAKNGKSVLLLTGGGDPAQDIPNDTFHFSLGPCLYFGYEKWGAMEGFFSKLAYPIPMLQKKGLLFRKITPMLQVVLPMHRISLHADDEACFDEFKREFGTVSQNLQAFLNHMGREAAAFYPYVGQFPQIEIEGMADRISEWKKHIEYAQAIQQQQKIKAAALLESHAFPPKVHEYFNLLFLCAYEKPLEAGSAFELIQLLSSFQKGGICFSGGYPALVSFFHDLIKERRGTILKEKAVFRPDSQGNPPERITLSGGEVVSAVHLVVARPSKKQRMTFYFKIPSELMPEPMGDNLLMTWEKPPPENVEDLILIRLSPLEAQDASAQTDRLMAVSLLLRGEAPLAEAAREDLNNRVLERLRWLIPFSESAIQCCAAPRDNDTGETDPFRIQGGFAGTEKEVMKGVFTYLQPKGRKNVYVVHSEQSDFIGWGTPFLAGHRLARIIEKSL